jgi:transcription-repair coupling factor (superfamily II helicase)
VPEKSRIKITGVCAPARGAVLAELARAHPAPVWLVVAEDLKAAEHLAEDLAFFHATSNDPRAWSTLVFPESMPDSRDLREAFAASSDRLTVLSRAPGHAGWKRRPTPWWLSPPPPPCCSRCRPSRNLPPVSSPSPVDRPDSFTGLLEQLQELDYDSEAVCEAPGHYAIRGGIVDVYPVTAEHTLPPRFLRR